MSFPDPTEEEVDGVEDETPETPDEPRAARTASSSRRSSRRRKPQVTQRTVVTCQVCKVTMPRLTVEHLQVHGLTMQRYARLYSGSSPISPGFLPPATAPDPTPLGIAQSLVASPSFVTTLADEVAEAIFSGPLRDRLRLALTSVLGSRLAMHGESVALLARVRRELGAAWRIEQGGENGGPTETRDLVAMAMQASGEVAKGEDALLRTIKLAIDENKGRDGVALDRGGFKPYTGEAEVLPVPVDLSADEREAVRSLLATLTQGVRTLSNGSRGVGSTGPVTDGVADPVPPLTPLAPTVTAAPVLPPVVPPSVSFDPLDL